MYSHDFQALIDAKQPTGEVIAVDQFMIVVSGLAPVGLNATVLFENDVQGLVSDINGHEVIVLNMTTEKVRVGTVVALRDDKLEVRASADLVGRVISPLGRPLDDKAVINTKTTRPVFYDAPDLMQRQLLDEQLETGVTLVDTLFPIVLGQRIAAIGDSKTGKTSFLLQLAANQANKQRLVIYVMISKSPTEINAAVARLKNDGSLAHTIVIATSVFDSLVESYLAPYIACAIGEYFWYGGHDVVVMYDDLTNHAQIYREISLMSGTSPGRDSYPGDTFFRHSSLLERAGKLASSGKTLTAIPVVLTPGNDITAYLPTNIISITDGQIIFDTNIFKEGRRPAINIGLSVSRVGGRAQTDNQKSIRATVSQYLNDYRGALEFSHFAAGLAPEAKHNLAMGQAIFEALNQKSTQRFSLSAQQLMLDSLLQAPDVDKLDIDLLKDNSTQSAPDLVSPQDNPEAYARAIKQAISQAGRSGSKS